VPGRRMSLRDADWLPYDHLRVVGPLAGVGAPALREALIALHRRYPRHPSVCLLDRSARRRIPVGAAEFAARVADDVAELDWPPPGGTDTGPARPGAVAGALRDALVGWPLGDRPLRMLVCRDFVGIRMSHTVGDGRVFNTLTPELLIAAAAGRPPRLPFPRPTRLPLARAALRFFGRDPRRVAALLTTPRPVLAGPSPDEPTRPWQPDVSSHYVRSDQDVLDRLRQWRDRNLPGVSGAALLFAAACAAFEEVGLRPDGAGIMILVDARRYLSSTATVDGNFAAAQYVSPTDPRDPRAIQQTMGATVASGRPLSTLALRDLYSLRRSRPARPGGPDRVRASPVPQLTLTHIGRLGEYAGLPWACPPAGRTLASAPTPGGPEAVTATFAELAGAIHLNVTFHRSTFDDRAVRTAAELVCADPLRLIATAPVASDRTARATTGEAGPPIR
jgi:hypothetical protein